MKILIIGGTRFVGHHIAQKAIDNGHEVTLFNRGKTESTINGSYEFIQGDRNTDLERLKNRKYDAVIDTCAYYPKQVESTVDILKGNVDKYLLISTISVYEPYKFNYTEEDKLKPVDLTSDKITGETYGPLKVGCEKVLIDKYGENNSIIIRPGYIVGDKDYTDRFSYWPVMMKNLNKMIVPSSMDLMYQFIDVKDLADFVVLSLEKDLSGAYHIIGPKDSLLYSDFIHLCRDLINPECELVEMHDDWFIRNGIVKQYMYPTYNDNYEGKVLFTADTSKAQEAGLTFRPIEETIFDAISWYEANRESVKDISAGMPIDEMKERVAKLK